MNISVLEYRLRYFEHHTKYGLEYANGQKKFHDSVNNCITSLKNKYKPLKAKFSATGAGVVPLDDASAKNLQEEVCCKFPWYKELDTIWHSNSSFAAKTTSSKPGADHYICVAGLAPPHIPGVLPGLSPPSHVPPPHNRPFTDSQIDPHLLAPAALALPNADFDTTMGNVPDLDNNDDNDLYSAAFCAPLGNALDHLDDDDMDTDAPHPTYDLNSPPKVAGKKQQLPSSPSPPPNHPIPFSIMQKSPTPFYDSHAAFSAQGPSGYDTSISAQLKTTGSKKKKAKSDIQEQVERVNGEIGSIQLDVTSCHNLKHECYLVKLNVKKDYHCETKKYKYLCEALALDKEAEMWCLKIQFHQMTQSGSTASASDS
ncbi:hypothetical protein BDR06DRAFT_1044731 [Suillus hirtellus]|nr:hypothetical protein BDR06DRAFT_1044731 [Suillus hirtellus]